MLISNSVGVNVFTASRTGRMTFPELVKSNQIKIDSDFLKMKLLEKEAYELKHWKKTEHALANILKNEILNFEWQYLCLCPSPPLSFTAISLSFLSELCQPLNWHFPILIIPRIEKKEFFFTWLMQTADHPTEKRQGQFGVLIPDLPALA